MQIRGRETEMHKLDGGNQWRKTKFKDKGEFFYPDVKSLRRGDTPSETQTNKEEIKSKRKRAEMSPK